jgi:Zn-dependent M16 (insulinase) family peptidase
MLTRGDLTREIKPFVNRFMTADTMRDGAKALETQVIAHPLGTSGIDYLTFMFDISKLPQKFFPYLGIFKTLLGVLDTE